MQYSCCPKDANFPQLQNPYAIQRIATPALILYLDLRDPVACRPASDQLIDHPTTPLKFLNQRYAIINNMPIAINRYLVVSLQISAGS